MATSYDMLIRHILLLKNNVNAMVMLGIIIICFILFTKSSKILIYKYPTLKLSYITDFMRRYINIITYNCIDYPLIKLTESVVYKPDKVDDKLYQKWMGQKNVINEKIITKSGDMIDACLYRYNKVPSYNDEIIYLYSHGNSGWLGMVLESPTCAYLSQMTTIFIYDYRGFGKSSGKPSDSGVFEDVITAWKFLVYTKGVDPRKIILFGHSLGVSITAYLAMHLIKTNQVFSKTLILQNGFESAFKIISDHSPVGAWLVRSKLNTTMYLKEIDMLCNDIKILIIHSINDTLIHIRHGQNLANSMVRNDTTFIAIDGNHDIMVYSNDVYTHIQKLHNNIIKINNN